MDAGAHAYSNLLIPSIHLDDSHVEAGLARQLLADVSRGLRRGRERRLQRLELLGFDGGARPAALPHRALLVVVRLLVAARVLVGQGAPAALLRVLAVVLRVLGVRGQTRVAARRNCAGEAGESS